MVVVARTGATRRPGKMLADLAGVPLFDRLWHRVTAAQTSGVAAVLATTHLKADDALVEVARRHNAQCYRGSVDDVMARILGACRTFQIDFAVIVEADELFSDPGHLRRLLEIGARGDAEFADLVGAPIGAWVSGVSADAMERAIETRGADSSEAWRRYFQAQRGFVVRKINVGAELPAFHPGTRLTIDYEEDIQLAAEIFGAFPTNAVPSLEQVVRLLGERPALLEINAKRNEEYWGRLEQLTSSGTTPIRKHTH